MNWKKIRNKYPRGQRAFESSIWYDEYNIRGLYDFFDEQGVYVDITYTTNGWKLPPWFIGCVYNIPVVMTKQYKSRRKAENAVFKEAFRILEERLTSNISTT